MWCSVCSEWKVGGYFFPELFVFTSGAEAEFSYSYIEKLQMCLLATNLKCIACYM
jgi:hypothetical protein